MGFLELAPPKVHFSMSQPLRQSRRTTLKGLLAICLPGDLLAAEIQSDISDELQVPDPVFFAQLQRLVRPAMIDISSGRVLKGISSLEQARALMAMSGDRNWILWSYINKPYGLALILLGQYREAIAPLKVAVDVETRMRASHVNKMQQLTKGLDEGMVRELLRVEYGRQALANLEKTGKAIHEIKDLLLDQSTGTMDPIELLLHAYAKTGDFSECKELLDPQILESEGPLAERELLPVALEYRLMKMGAALSNSGEKLNAARAFDAAMNVNLFRLRTVGQFVASSDVRLATYSVRRLVLSAALGNADFAGLTKEQSLALIYKIVETKGLGVRYAEQFNRLLGLSKSATAALVRKQLQEIETMESAIPDGKAQPSDLLFFNEQRSKVISAVMPELWDSGLSEVFQDGKTILTNARNALGDGAMIGYMAYTPLSAEKFSFGPSRYLRFCMTEDDIQLADVGKKDVVDNAIFQLRGQILNGQVTRESKENLSALLLGNLPPSVLQSTSWTIEPDGALNLLPFETLPNAKAHPLISSVDIGYVTSFGQVRKKTVRAHAGKARIIADPEFHNPHEVVPLAKRRGRGSVKVVQRGATVDLMDIQPLPETRLEAAAVERSLRKLGVESETYLGHRADVHSLEMTVSPRILHVATHGVLIPPPVLPPVSGTDPLGQSETYIIGLPGKNSGLAVAGVDKPVLVYASEIARFPLQNTELVVLSACDSGNGTVDVGEGMASLRRAVETAGASASVTSLWSVPSDETTKLMSSFYDYLAKGKGKRGALRQAKLDSIAKDPDPYNWAGFVFAGQE
jgi:CHAT domain-containing protein